MKDAIIINHSYRQLKSAEKEVKDYLYGHSSDRLAKVMANASIRMSEFPDKRSFKWTLV